MRRTASSVLRDLEVRVANLEKQSSKYLMLDLDSDGVPFQQGKFDGFKRNLPNQRMEENYRDSDENVLFVSNSFNDLLKKKGLHTDLVAERGQGVSILIDNSRGNAMDLLQGIRYGVKWFGDDKVYHLGTMWFLSENRDGDIILSLNK